MASKALGLAALLFWALPAAAEVQLHSVRWQMLLRQPGQAAKAVELKELMAKPGAPLGGRLIARLKLLNRGPANEGLLLKYVVSAKIARLDENDAEASWSLPFTIEQKRVPRIGANEYLETALDPTALTEVYLKKVYREGYWPRELKLQVMLEPRRDVKGPLQILEKTLSVAQ